MFLFDVIVCVTICREFVNICHAALDLNAQLIGVDQLVYHKSLKDNFRQIVLRLAELFGETVSASVCLSVRLSVVELSDCSLFVYGLHVACNVVDTSLWQTSAVCLLQLLSDEQLGIQPDRQSLSNVSLDGSSSSRFSSA